MTNHNKFQQSVAIKSGITVSAWVHSITSSISQYFNLIEKNYALTQLNTQLLNENEILKQHILSQNPDTTTQLTDVEKEINYIDAKVIYNTIYKTKNHIIINKGSKHGVAPDMGVMAPSGVVGVIEKVSTNYSVVLPLINPEQRISAKLKRNYQLGSITWKGFDPYHVQMEEVPAHAIVEIGDTIVTSGYSAIFPSDQLIGIVENASLSENARFWKINIRTSVNFSRLDYVIISAYTHQDEYNNLVSELTH